MCAPLLEFPLVQPSLLSLPPGAGPLCSVWRISSRYLCASTPLWSAGMFLHHHVVWNLRFCFTGSTQNTALAPEGMGLVFLRAGKMAHQVKALAEQAWQPAFNPQDPPKGGQGEPASQSCPLTPACPLWHNSNFIFTVKRGAGQMARWLRMCDALSGGLHSVASTRVRWLTDACKSPSGGSSVLFCPGKTPSHTWQRHA